MSALQVMNAITRIRPPLIGHSSGKTSQMRAISPDHRMCPGLLGFWAFGLFG
jgi:hypothetical protein